MKLPSIVFKLLRRYPFMYQVNKGHNSVKTELVMILVFYHLSKGHNLFSSRNGYDSFSPHIDK